MAGRSEHVVEHEHSANGGGGSAIPAHFEIPHFCQPSDGADENKSEEKIAWRVTATADTPGVKFKTDFIVPVFKLAGNVPSIAVFADAP